MAHVATGTDHRYNPLWDAQPAGFRLRQTHVAIALSIAAHAGLGYAVYELKIKPTYREYSDEAIVAEILPRLRPPPPPPEAAEPPPAKQEAPPPEQPITPRPALLPQIPVGVPTVSIEAPPPPEPSIPEPPAEPVVAPAPPPTLVNPKWSSRPSAEDMARYYPERAQRLGANGSVTLQCQVTAKGAVDACQVLSESPAAHGFGEAALKLSRLFRMKPGMQDGQAVEGAFVKIPIGFRIAD